MENSCPVLSGRNKVISGFIPVGKREAYLAAPLFDEEAAAEREKARAQGTADPQAMSDAKRAALKRLFDLQVAGPWKEMIDQAYTEYQKSTQWADEPPAINDSLAPPSPNQGDIDSRKNNLKVSREQIQTLSWYVLVDLMHYLDKYLHNVYRVIAGKDNRSDLTRTEERNLYDALASVTLHEDLIAALDIVDYHSHTQIKGQLIQALQALIANSQIEVNLEKVDEPYDQSTNTYKGWPSFLFPLADPELVALGPLPDLTVDSATLAEGEPDVSMARVEALSELVALALEDSLPLEAPEVVTFREPELDNGDGWFVIRCIHEQPNCGPFYPAVLSQPTEPFKMASFFDSDAPGRPIRIPMPPDISPAGLRKYCKNTTLMISDMLCGKIKNIRRITFGDLVLSVLPWPFHKDLPRPSKTGPCRKGGNSFGMFCSLSIPIVTLAALILLIIIVALFNTFFYWLPLLFTCFPIPGLSGKKS